MENNTLNDILERLVASLTEEQKEKVKDCQDLNELTARLGELGVELPDELLDDVGGGFNLGSLINRPLVGPAFGGLFSRLFGSASSDGGVDATHMDLKGNPSLGAVHMDLKGAPKVSAVHTDVSAESKQGKSQYV